MGTGSGGAAGDGERRLMSNVAIVGNTGWGRTIANLLCRNLADVRLVTRTAEEAALLRGGGAEYRVVHEPAVALTDAEYIFPRFKLRVAVSMSQEPPSSNSKQLIPFCELANRLDFVSMI